MRFDNAFLTSKGNVGMQFSVFNPKTKEVTVLTIYRDHSGKVVVSEEATEQQKEFMLKQYERREKWYKK